MTYKEYKNNSYNLYTVKTDKFKTCHMEIVFYRKLDKDRITKENVLADMLSHSSKKYDKRKYVVEKLEDLYNASFYATTSKVGNIRTINFIYNFIDPVYADKSYLKEVIKFPFEMIFNPNVKNNEFDSRALKIIKNRNLADIESIKENPSRYAVKRALQVTDKDMPSSYQFVGNIVDLNKITSANLYETYKDLLNNYYCDIYLIGNLNMDKINLMIEDYFQNDQIKTEELNPFTELKILSKVKDIKEKDNLNQASLVCVYELNNLNDFEKNYVIPIFNNIFGQGSLSNKLYQNLREKNSLCYSVRSMYQKFDNLLIIHTGIDIKNRTKAIKLIKKSLDEMTGGKFSKDDVENAINLSTNSLKSALDSPTSICDNYFFHNMASSPILEERFENILKVTKDDIIKAAKKIKLVTIYSLAKDDEK